MRKKIDINVNLNNIALNFVNLRKKTGYGKDVIPVIKGNAYGIGVFNIIDTLLNIEYPQNKYFVFAVREAIEIRKIFNNDDLEIYVLSGIFEDDALLFKKYNLVPVINSYSQLELANKFGINKIILQFNTGMNRNGIEVDDKTLSSVKNYTIKKKMNVIMIMSHLCCAENRDNPNNEIQINNFKKVASFFQDSAILKSLYASDAVINFEHSDFCNSCRVGLALYGYYKESRPTITIESTLLTDWKDMYIPLGISNGLTTYYGQGNGYVILEGKKVYTREITRDSIYLDMKKTFGDNYEVIDFVCKKVTILGDGISMADFEKMNFNLSIVDIIPRLISNCTKDTSLSIPEYSINIPQIREDCSESPSKITAIYKNGKLREFYSTIIEKRNITENGVVGYDATRTVIIGDKLATFAGGYLDGISRNISNTSSSVFVETKSGKLIECEIFGKISMDQTTIKIPENAFDDISIGAKVIIFNDDYSSERFERVTKLSRDELFFYTDKSSRVTLKNL
jgi:alanine racemase